MLSPGSYDVIVLIAGLIAKGGNCRGREMARDVVPRLLHTPHFDIMYSIMLINHT